VSTTVQIAPEDITVARPQIVLDVQTKVNWADDWASTPYTKYLSPLWWRESLAPGIGEAHFSYVYGRQTREDRAALADEEPLDFTDVYVRILRTTSDGTYAVWTGIIAHQSYDIEGTTPTDQPSGSQTVVAYALEHLLDREPMVGAHVDSGGSIVEIGWEPTFNERNRFGPGLSGNRTTDEGADGAHVFSADGAVWDNQDIVWYLLTYHAPAGWTFDDVTGTPGFLNRLKTLHNLGGQTLFQALNHLIPRRRCLGWRLVVGPDPDKHLSIEVFPFVGEDISVGDQTFAANPNQFELTLDDAVDVDSAVLHLATTLQYDKIVVRGERPVVCFTVSFTDSTLEAAWSGDEETAYKAGDTVEDDADANDTERKATQHDRVYQAFRIPYAWDWFAGNGVGAGFNIASLAFGDDGSRLPATTGDYWPAARRLLRHLPIEKPAEATGAEPEFRDPLVVIKDSYGRCYETARIVDEEGHRTKMSVRMLTREFGLTVKPLINHVLGLNHFDPTAGGTGDTGTAPQLDYQQLIATVATHTDQRFQVVAQRPEAEQHETVRTLVLDVPDAHYWYIMPGTVTGVADEALVHHTGECELRNDVARLRAVAATAMAYYGQRRAAIRLSVQGLWNGLPLGGYVKDVSSSWHLEPVGAVVTSKLFTNSEPPTTVIETSFAELDARGTVSDIPGHSDVRAVGRILSDHAAQLRELRDEVTAETSEVGGPAVKPRFWAQVVATAPDGYSIPSGKPVYAVKKLRSDPAAEFDAEDVVSVEFDTAHPLHVMAWNAAEADTAHALHEDDTAGDTDAVIVEVTHLRSSGGALPERQYLFRRAVTAPPGWTQFADRRYVETGTWAASDVSYIVEGDLDLYGESRVLLAWEVGDDGKTVAQPAAEYMSIWLGGTGAQAGTRPILRVIPVATYITYFRWRGVLTMEWITSQYTPSTVGFGTVSVSSAYDIISGIDVYGDWNAGAAARTHPFCHNLVRPANTHGIRLRLVPSSIQITVDDPGHNDDCWVQAQLQSSLGDLMGHYMIHEQYEP